MNVTTQWVCFKTEKNSVAILLSRHIGGEVTELQFVLDGWIMEGYRGLFSSQDGALTAGLERLRAGLVGEEVSVTVQVSCEMLGSDEVAALIEGAGISSHAVALV